MNYKICMHVIGTKYKLNNLNILNNYLYIINLNNASTYVLKILFRLESANIRI